MKLSASPFHALQFRTPAFFKGCGPAPALRQADILQQIGWQIRNIGPSARARGKADKDRIDKPFD